MMDDPRQPRPDIDYPCQWGYRIIGEREDAIRGAVASIVGQAEHELERSNSSRTGRYCALRLVLTVRDETQRNAIFQALNEHDAVRFVL